MSTATGGWWAPVQEVPLTAKAVGAVLVPLYVNWAPVVTAAPAAIVLFQSAWATVTFFPDWDQVPLQPLESFWSPL